MTIYWMRWNLRDTHWQYREWSYWHALLVEEPDETAGVVTGRSSGVFLCGRAGPSGNPQWQILPKKPDKPRLGRVCRCCERRVQKILERRRKEALDGNQ